MEGPLPMLLSGLTGARVIVMLGETTRTTVECEVAAAKVHV